MRQKFRPVIATIIGLAVAATMLGSSPASAWTETDPPAIPPKSDIVGVGSDTTEDVIGKVGDTLAKSGFTENYNATDPNAKLWAWDAFGDPPTIIPSEGCDPITRPAGSSAGIAALKADQAAGTKCIDFARSSRPKNPATDGDLVFIPFGRDGVTWATFPTEPGGSDFNAPASLTGAQLTSIYTCEITNWSQVGGEDVGIEAYLPQTGSGTRAFWLAAIGVPTPGACVNQPAGLEESSGEGIPVEDRPVAILPYSIAVHIAQGKDVQEDLRAGAVLRQIDGKKPVVKRKLNPDFAPAFLRQVFNVLKPEDQNKKSFKKVFATNGYICKHPKITQTFGFGKLTGAACGY